MKTVLVTGSTGFIGSNLVKALSAEKRYNVIGVVEDESGFTDRYQCNDYLRTVSNNDLLNGRMTSVDIAVNCAFARSNDAFLLADALKFTELLALAFKKIGVGSLINISSQGVYKRLPSEELQTEESAIEPIDMYSMAKYATEQIFIASECAHHITNVRLASINMKQRFLFAFVKKILAGEQIVLTAPRQNAALLDVRDAVSGLQAIINIQESDRKPVYNLGTGTQMTILEYANIAVDTLKQYGCSGKIVVDEKASGANSGMDCSRIMKDTGWKPELTVKDMVKEFYLELAKGNKND